MRQTALSFLVIAACVVASLPCQAIERSAVVIGSRVQMHESAGGDSPVVGLVNDGVEVAIVGRQPRPVAVGNFTDYWYHVSYRGHNGWVFGQFLLVSTGGRGLARIFSADDMTGYCRQAMNNLIAIKDARIYDALVDESARFLQDVDEMAADPFLSPYASLLEPYRVLAAWCLAMGYAGAGDAGEAEKVRAQLGGVGRTAVLPDGSTLGARMDELDELMGTKGETAPK